MPIVRNDDAKIQINENQLQTIVNFSESRLAAIVRQAIAEIIVTSSAETLPKERKILYSIRELSDFLGCSTVTAQKFKNDGRIPYRQIGRKVQFDTASVLQAMEKTKVKTRK